MSNELRNNKQELEMPSDVRSGFESSVSSHEYQSHDLVFMTLCNVFINFGQASLKPLNLRLKSDLSKVMRIESPTAGIIRVRTGGLGGVTSGSCGINCVFVFNSSSSLFKRG